MRKLSLTLLAAALTAAVSAQKLPADYYRFPLAGVAGYYSANFGEMRPNHFHSGVDIKTDGVTGKAVVAVADGYVVRVGISPGGYGRALYIAHPNGTTSVYGHLERFREDIESYLRYKRYEQGRSNVDFTCPPSLFPVRAGDTIARSGNSGMSFGPHLHFEIRRSSDQRTLNTLASGVLPVKDHTPPRIMRLHYVEVDTVRGVPVHSRPRAYDAVQHASGSYGLQQRVTVGRRGYFILECSDRKEGVQNTFGIYRITEEVDGEVRYEYCMEGFLFSDTRYCNAVSHYPMQLTSRNEVIRLTQMAGCPSRFYPVMKNRALITTPAGESQEVRITVEDDCGNRSQLDFTVGGVADNRCFRAAPCDSLPVIRHDRPFSHEGEGVRIEIPAGTLYEPCFYTQRPYTKPLPEAPSLRFLSRGVEVLDVRLPMHTYATLWIDGSEVPADLRRHTILASISPKGQLRYEGGAWHDGGIRLRTRSLGVFFLVADTVRPVIRPRFQIETLRQRQSITFAVSDNFSGVTKVECLIDGRMAILEENRVKGSVTHHFDDEIFGRDRDHTIRLTATDGAGNVTVWERTYHR